MQMKFQEKSVQLHELFTRLMYEVPVPQEPTLPHSFCFSHRQNGRQTKQICGKSVEVQNVHKRKLHRLSTFKGFIGFCMHIENVHNLSIKRCGVYIDNIFMYSIPVDTKQCANLSIK